MGADQRLGLARRAYLRAVEVARLRSTPMAWRRLLTAARNLDAAKRDGARDRAGLRTEADADHGRERRKNLDGGAPLAGAEHDDTPLVPFDEHCAAASAALARWWALARECDRARALVRRSGALMEESRALCASIREIAAWPVPSPARELLADA